MKVTQLHQLKGSLYTAMTGGEKSLLCLIQIESGVYKLIEFEDANRYFDERFENEEVSRFYKYLKANKVTDLGIFYNDIANVNLKTVELLYAQKT